MATWKQSGTGILILILCVATVSAAEVQYPHNLRKYVTDNADLFTQPELIALNDKCSVIERETGVEIAIVTVPDTGGQDLILYAAKTGEINGVGNAQLNNGLVILVSISNQPGWALETGRGAESTVTDLRASEFLRHADPALDSGDYYTGISIILQDIQNLYTSQVTATQAPARTMNTPVSGVLGIAGVILVVFMKVKVR